MIFVTRSVLPPLEKYTAYLRKIWESRWLTNNGELVQLFESRLQEYLRTDNLAVLSNGTVALQIALRLFARGGEVITTPFTFAATTNSILWEGFTPVFADIDHDTYNIDPSEVEKKITERTAAIMPVHVYGNPCDADRLEEIARRRGIPVIYDAAHAFGVEYNGRAVMGLGDASTLSFHPTKVFHTIEGGAVALRDPALFKKLLLVRNHGIAGEEKVVIPGLNAKMNEFQAAMGLCNLETVDEAIAARKAVYERYLDGLAGTGLKFQKLVASRYNYSYMPVCFASSSKRDAAHDELVKSGIKPRKYFYPLAVHFDYYASSGEDLVESCALKRAADIADRVLCLPIYPELQRDTVDKVVAVIKGLS